MATWSTEELRKMLKPDDLHISPFRDDGVTYGIPTWIWFVAAGDALYVRAYSGQRSRWCQAAVRQKVGRITVAGMRKEVTFESVDGRSTTSSTTPTARGTMAVHISAQCSAHALAPQQSRSCRATPVPDGDLGSGYRQDELPINMTQPDPRTDHQVINACCRSISTRNQSHLP